MRDAGFRMRDAGCGPARSPRGGRWPESRISNPESRIAQPFSAFVTVCSGGCRLRIWRGCGMLWVKCAGVTHDEIVAAIAYLPALEDVCLRHGAGGRVQAVHLRAGAAVWHCGVGVQYQRRRAARGRRRGRDTAAVSHRAARGAAGAGAYRGDQRGRAAVRGMQRVRDQAQPGPGGSEHLHSAGHRHLRGLCRGYYHAGQPALSVPIHQLHQLRAALHHHSRRAL